MIDHSQPGRRPASGPLKSGTGTSPQRKAVEKNDDSLAASPLFQQPVGGAASRPAIAAQPIERERLNELARREPRVVLGVVEYWLSSAEF
jgi:hypothetical protein